MLPTGAEQPKRKTQKKRVSSGTEERERKKIIRRAIDTSSDEYSEDEIQRAEVTGGAKPMSEITAGEESRKNYMTESSGNEQGTSEPTVRAKRNRGSHATFYEAAKRGQQDGWRKDQFKLSEVAKDLVKREDRDRAGS